MENLKFLGLMFIKPGFAFSEIMDRGNWLIAVVIALAVGAGYFAAVNYRLNAAYAIPTIREFFNEDLYTETDPELADKQYAEAMRQYRKVMAERNTVPVLGDTFFRFFSFEPAAFYRPVLAISLFQVPLIILLVSLFSGIASFGLLFRRDYAVLATCTMMAWAGGHLPFALAGLALFGTETDPRILFALWLSSGILFGVFLTFAIRTIFGTGYGISIAAAVLSWPAFPLAMYVFQFVSPWLLSPFILFWAVIYFGGYLGGEVRGFGNALRHRQDLKRFLQNATVNPKDADAHVQLGLIYLSRRQETKAVEHLKKALEIDANEIDANYEMGKIERLHGSLQSALDHFATVVEQNDKHALSEIWREIGKTYLDANMLNEAHDALEKFAARRSADVEGLYYFGLVLKAEGKIDEAREYFQQAVDTAKAAPEFSRRGAKQWRDLAQKEL